jgi:hypothetical protein
MCKYLSCTLLTLNANILVVDVEGHVMGRNFRGSECLLKLDNIFVTTNKYIKWKFIMFISALYSVYCSMGITRVHSIDI